MTSLRYARDQFGCQGEVVVSIVMPVYNTPAAILEAAILSVLAQSHPGWELCICDDCSTSRQTLDVMEKFRGIDVRIKICRSPRNLHIAGATNQAAEFATGEFVGFLDHDDVLDRDAVAEVARRVAAEPDVDMIYSDEDKINPDGDYTEPYFKPDWSPEHLRSVMYVLHFMVVRKSLFFDLGGMHPDFSGSQDYDLALRASLKARKVLHIPRILYHWRIIPGSAAAELDAKPDALINSRRALEAFVKPDDGVVVAGLYPGSYRVKWPVSPTEPVTLLILTNSRRRNVENRGYILMIEHFVDSILQRSTHKGLRILVLDDGGMPKDVRAKMVTKGVAVKRYDLKGAFNYSHKLNAGFKLVETEYVIALNDDLEVIAPDWIEALLEMISRPDVAVAGAKLLFPDDTIQHAGMALGVCGAATHLFYKMPDAEIGYNGYTHLIRNYSAVTGAVMATRMSVVRELDGFDEAYGTDYNDVDFCLRCVRAGYRIVYTPYAKLYHFEASTIKRLQPDKKNQQRFEREWSVEIERDPYYNVNLPRDRSDFLISGW
jgi:GT2 family glycosyltransferase